MPDKKMIMVVATAFSDPTTGRILVAQWNEAFKIGLALTEKGYTNFSDRIYIPPNMPVASDIAYAIVAGIGSITNVHLSLKVPGTSEDELSYLAWDTNPDEIQLVIMSRPDAELAANSIGDGTDPGYALAHLSVMLYTFEVVDGGLPRDVEFVSYELLQFILGS